MVCKKCKSHNVRVDSKKVKIPFALTFSILFCVIGVLVFGAPNGLLSVIPGCLFGSIVGTLCPDIYESFATCQDCGHHWKVKNKKGEG